MKHIGLFEGIGGFSLAAKWMGWETVAWCEINPFCQSVLKKRFPSAEALEDITKINFTKYANRIDVLTGGFPCQPFSTAGEGKGEKDERFLFPEMLRAIREIKPRWVVAENVRGLTARKFKNVFEQICSSLENEGYTVLPLLIPATAVGANHERYRLWIVAYSNITGLQGSGALLGCLQSKEIKDWKTSGLINFIQRYSMPYVCRDHNGISRKLDGNRLMALGNAVVPQLVFKIFQAIQDYENLNQ